ncbi:Cytoplasmic dynein 1 intermediate chain 1 [Wallemia ichthyophaga EXF-994]|uniref:Cytoplasmic dynein 1 intermediate chain 1 n=1 Tax=Wallemia ichthyophaga (strain EXF-994 / CBS 113033) TaxID=1299270 RepID=R9ARD2_WALI9|nr:Cytoplasmic dynein 1 intermediate chain 1 [Wallemia ichthyophaga EXF-994]EOR04762.1 Cytoplasmic dynein 1 intermediate chain 1 [Wallemia ichthyophaga EXF-994]
MTGSGTPAPIKSKKSTFHQRSSYFDRENELSAVDTFRGFYTLFWIFAAMTGIRTAVETYDATGSILGLNFGRLISRDGLVLAISDAILVASTCLSFLFIKAIQRGWISYNAVGLSIQHVLQLFFLAIPVFWAFQRNWPWVQSGFLTLHSLTMIMKIHSYMATNGHFANLHSKIKSLEAQLAKLSNSSLEATVEQREAEVSNRAESDLRQRKAFSKAITRVEQEEQASNSGVSTPLGSNEIETAHVNDVHHHPLTTSSNPDVAKVASEINELTSHITSHGPTKISYPDNVTLANFLDYLLIPTLVYELEYPRTERVRLWYVIEKTLATFGTFYILYMISEHYISPKMPRPEESFARTWLDLCIPFLCNYVLLFYIIFECICNAFAELTRFADREFYEDWWNATTWDQFARKWNKPVHMFLLRHVYVSTLSTYKISKQSATMLTFLLSALIHELVMAVVTKKIRMYLFVLQMAQLPMIAIGRLPLVRRYPEFANMFFWLGLMSGPPLLADTPIYTSIHTPIMDRRKAEIEEKRAKLGELKRARGERKRGLDSANKSTADSVAGAAQAAEISSVTDYNRIGKKEIDDLVASLVGSNSSVLSDRTNDIRREGQSEQAEESQVTKAEYTQQPILQSVDHEVFYLPLKETVTYNKEVQTAFIPDDEHETLVDSAVGTETADELRQRMHKEEHLRVENERKLAEEEAAIQREIDQEILDISEEERLAVYTSPDFGDFIESSSKMIQRALSDNYDVTRDYRMAMDNANHDNESKNMKLVCSFADEKWTKNRSITAVDWSHIFSELSLAAYNKNSASFNDPNGIVAVWNMHLLDRPEFVLHSQSDVLSATFSPFHANLIFGGTYSGQILLWDTRAKQTPVLRTPLSATGHTHPVYDMQVIGTQNANNLMTTSTDGLVCGWTVDMLAQPQESIELSRTGNSKTDEVAITCFDLPHAETMSFYVGTEEGAIYHAHRHDRAGVKAGIDHNEIYSDHSAPVNSLDFHPLSLNRTTTNTNDFTDLFLTTSIDWTIKLWSTKGITAANGQQQQQQQQQTQTQHTQQHHKPLQTFDEHTDCVYDAKWHPHHPAVFGSVDGCGEFKLWNLNVDTEVPISSAVPSSRALNRMSWERKEGKRVGLGSSDGNLYVYDIGEQAGLRGGTTEWDELQTSPQSSPVSSPTQSPFLYAPPAPTNQALFFHQQQQQWAAAAAAYHHQQLMLQQNHMFTPPNPDFTGRRRTSSGPQKPSSTHPYQESRQQSQSYSQVASLNPRSTANHRRSKSDALSKDDLIVRNTTKGSTGSLGGPGSPSGPGSVASPTSRPMVNRTESTPATGASSSHKKHDDLVDDFSPPMGRMRKNSHSSNDSRSSRQSSATQATQSPQSTHKDSPTSLNNNKQSQHVRPSPLSQQSPHNLNDTIANKTDKPGLKSRFKRALSSSNDISERIPIDDSAIGKNSSASSPLATKSQPQTQPNKQSPSPQLPPRTRTISESNRVRPGENNEANEKPAKKHSIFNSKFNVSTDNISISSAASSASVMLRKIGSVGKIARRSSFAGLTNLFNKDKDRDSGGEEPEDMNNKSIGSKLKKKKKNKRKKEPSTSISHATAEVDRHSIINEEPEYIDGLSPAAALVKQHQEQVAAAEAKSAKSSKSSKSSSRLNSNSYNHAGSDSKSRLPGAIEAKGDGDSIVSQDDDDLTQGLQGVQIHQEEWHGSCQYDSNAAPHRREHILKGILKGARTYRQEDFEERQQLRGRSNSFTFTNIMKDEDGREVQPQVSHQLPSPDADKIDGIASRPSSMHKPIDKPLVNHNNSTSALPVQAMINLAAQPKRKCSFANSMGVQTTWPATIYDRRGEPATCNRLTPELAQMIKEEMNAFKMEEMRVHASSRLNTQFFL